MAIDNNLGENWWKTASQRKISSYYPKHYRGVKFEIREPILEIGGGAGTFLKYLGIKNATIMDLAGKESLVGNYKFITADITKNIPKNKKYKTIFLMETLEHIRNPLYVMAQVYDILEDDGICYVAVPYTPLDVKREKEQNPLNAHVCRWKDFELKTQLNKVGFNVKFIKKRRRYLNTAFWLPHCFLIAKLTKRLKH